MKMKILDEEGDEIVPLRAQDDKSEVRWQEKQVFEKMHNSVVHLGVDRTYKALKLQGHNWMGINEDLKNHI